MKNVRALPFLCVLSVHYHLCAYAAHLVGEGGMGLVLQRALYS